MPKPAVHALLWSSTGNAYAVYEQGQQQFAPVSDDDGTWRAWLAIRRSFAFQGKYGHLNLLRETRPRGSEGYWYAYRRQGKRKIKRYAGRTTDISIACLEQLAQSLDSRVLDSPVHTPHSIERRSQQHAAPRVPQAPLPERQFTPSALPPPALPIAAAQGPLLASSLCPPTQTATLIPRERLLALLDAGLERRLTLLTAPAGFGNDVT